jgi:LysM repeat protein
MTAMIRLLVTIAAVLSADASFCNSTDPIEQCYTVTNLPTEAKTIEELATKLGGNPHMLAEHNLMGISSKISPGTVLRNPFKPCEDKAGTWICYTVQKGETFETIANSDHAMIRSVQSMLDLNVDLIYMEQTLYEGMRIRLPAMTNVNCLPGVRTARSAAIDFCFKVCTDPSTYECSKPDTIESIAAAFSVSTAQLIQANLATLAVTQTHVNTTLNHGMHLRIPNPHASPPSPCTKIDGAWDCYTVQKGDNLHNISVATTIHELILCEVNGISNCSEIMPGTTLAIPQRGYMTAPKSKDVHYDTGCSNEVAQGDWFCFTVQAGALRIHCILIHTVLIHCTDVLH